MLSEISSSRQIRIRDFRYPKENLSLILTFLTLIAIYTCAILLFPRSAAQVWNALAITAGGILVYIITVLIQQRSVFGSLVRVSPRQFSEIYEAGSIAAVRLSSPLLPIYVKRSSEQNIYTLGFSRQPLIVITSSMIDQMSTESLQFFIGREIGHIRAGHTWLRTLLHPLGAGIPLIGNLLDSVIFGDWINRSEFTADRAGFIACDSLSVSVSSMIKFGVGTVLFQKMDIREFLEQVNDLRSVGGRVMEIMAEQPYLIERVRKLVRFALSKEFNGQLPSERLSTSILDHMPQAFIDSRAINFEVSQPKPEIDDDIVPVTVVSKLSADPQHYSLIPQLIFEVAKSGEMYPLRNPRTRIGRNLDNDIVVSNDERISRYHAEILMEGDKLMILDCGSRNGVWLDGERIAMKAELKPNRLVRLGKRFTFMVKEAEG
jgi:Zn-dependent protease with chaperone function